MHEDFQEAKYKCMRDQAMMKMNASNQIATKMALTDDSGKSAHICK